MRKIEQISINAADCERLEWFVHDRSTPQMVVLTVRIVLLAGDGRTAEGISATVGKSLLRVRRWRRSYVAKRGGRAAATRLSRVKPLTAEKIRQVAHMMLHTHLGFLAQHGRGVLRGDHPKPHTPRCLQKRHQM
jgi:hypothetical protein